VERDERIADQPETVERLGGGEQDNERFPGDGERVADRIFIGRVATPIVVGDAQRDSGGLKAG
jgi:hypothetical protein